MFAKRVVAECPWCGVVSSCVQVCSPRGPDNKWVRLRCNAAKCKADRQADDDREFEQRLE